MTDEQVPTIDEKLSALVVPADNKTHGHDQAVRLYQLGAEQYISLPQVVVVRETSSGKTTLVSALAGVTLLTTPARCPIRLVLRRGPQFIGKAFIRRVGPAPDNHEVAIVRVDDVSSPVNQLHHTK